MLVKVFITNRIRHCGTGLLLCAVALALSGAAAPGVRAQTTAPGAPTGLSATAGNQKADLSWSAPATGGTVSSYEYRWKQSSRTFWERWKSAGAGTTQAVTGLTNGVQHSFQVRAKNNAGAGPASSEATAKPLPPPPNAPTLDPASDSGASSTDLITNDQNLKINLSGLLPPTRPRLGNLVNVDLSSGPYNTQAGRHITGGASSAKIESSWAVNGTLTVKARQSPNSTVAGYSPFSSPLTITFDIAKPKISSVSYDISTKVLTLNFSEKMDASTLALNRMHLRLHGAVTGGVTLTGATASTTDATTITVTLTDDQAQTILPYKTLRLDTDDTERGTGVCTTPESGEFRSAVCDIAGNGLDTSIGTGGHVNIPVTVPAPAAPGKPDLLALADTGEDNSDDITNGVGEGSAAFAVYNLTDHVLVTLTLKKGTTTFTLEEGGTSPHRLDIIRRLTDGIWTASATQTTAGAESASGPELSVTMDRTNASLLSAAYDSGTNQLQLTFSEKMNASTMKPGNLSVRDTDGTPPAQTLTGAAVSTTDSQTLTITLTGTQATAVEGMGSPQLRMDNSTVDDIAGNVAYPVFFGRQIVQSGSAPTGAPVLTASAGNAQATLTWTTPSGTVTSYDYSQDGGLNWTAVPGSGPTTQTYVVTGLANGTQYTFQVRARNAASPGTPSNSVNATPQGGGGGGGGGNGDGSSGNSPPSVIRPIDNRRVSIGGTVEVNICDVFRDPDGDPLTYTAVTSDGSRATVTVTGCALIISGITKGRAEISVTADDGRGGTAGDTFTVIVNSDPLVTKPLENQVVRVGRTVDVEVSGAFRDPDGDQLSYTAVTSDGSRAAVTVAGSTVRVAGVAKGRAEISVTASDGLGGTAGDTFTVTVVASAAYPFILPELARAMAGHTVGAIARRVERAADGGDGIRTVSLGGQSTLTGMLTAHGQSLAEENPAMLEMLADSDFTLSFDAADAAAGGGLYSLSFWGSGDYTRLSDSSGALSWDGGVFNLHVGADSRLHRNLLAGVAMSWGKGEADYNNDGVRGRNKVTVTGVHPYLGLTMGRMTLWGTGGYGWGTLDIDESGLGQTTSDVTMLTMGVGGTGHLLRSGGTSLRLRTEFMQARMSVQDGFGIESLDIDVNRLRVSMEAAHAWKFSGGAVLLPSVEVGYRRDGGDGKTGSGAEVAGSLHFAAPAGLSLEGRGRALLNRGDIREWGVSGLVLWGDPRSRGLSASVMPVYGTPHGDADAIWSPQWLSGDELQVLDPEARVEGLLGYGFEVSRGIFTPYGGFVLGESENSQRVGMRWARESAFRLRLEGKRREHHGYDRPEHVLMLYGRVPD